MLVARATGSDPEVTEILPSMSSYYRHRDVPTHVCRVVSIAFRMTPGAGEPNPSDESGGMRFVTRHEFVGLPFWPAHERIREEFLRDPRIPVVQ